MNLLEEKDYKNVIAPLQAVPINTLFAKAVLHGEAAGRVYADDADHPATFLISHSYGMSLLFGDTHACAGNSQFNAWLTDYVLNKQNVRERHEWLQVWPEGLNGVFGQLSGSNLIKKGESANPNDAESRVMEYTRVNFTFDREKFETAFGGFKPEAHGVIRTTKEIYEGLHGSVLPGYFWKDAGQFLSRGAGFTVMADGEAASTAFSAFVMEGQLELGIETAEKHRGKGYALHACAALIRHCLESGLEPVWACRLENTASYHLAQKLGFTPCRLIPYYCLPV